MRQLYFKSALHNQDFCDHSRNFAEVNSKFRRICKKCLRELIQLFPQTSYKSFKTLNFSTLKSYCDHRNFDSVEPSSDFVREITQALVYIG